jgi:hypothetical protein
VISVNIVSDIPSTRAVQLSRFAPLAAFLAVSTAVALPILMHAALPSVDLPNHIARYAIMANPTGPLGEYYSVPGFSAVPNSAVDLIWRLTGMQGDPIRFANVIFAIYAVNFVASVMVLSRVLLGRWTVWPAVSGFLVYNGPFFWGFQNYLFSVPFALYGLALWIATERRPILTRLLIFVPLAAGLYLMHFFAFLALALMAFGREFQKLVDAGPKWLTLCMVSIPMALPFAFPIVWMLSGPISEQGALTQFQGIGRRVEALLSPVSATTLDEVPIMNEFGLFGLAVLFVCLSTALVRHGPRLTADRRVLGAFLALLFVAAIAPMWLNGVAYVHIRLPFVVFAVLIAGTSWQDLSVRQSGVLVVMFAALIGVRSLQFERFAATNDKDIHDLETVLQDLPPASRLLPLRAPGQVGMKRLWQAQAYAVTLRQSFVPTLFQGVHALQVRKEWLGYTHPALFAIDIRRILEPHSKRPRSQLAFWRDWEDVFTHAIVIDQFDSRLIENQPLKEIGQSGRFTLLEVVRQ